MSFAHAHPLVPVGESPHAQKIEFYRPNLNLKEMSIFSKITSFLIDNK